MTMIPTISVRPITTDAKVAEDVIGGHSRNHCTDFAPKIFG